MESLMKDSTVSISSARALVFLMGGVVVSFLIATIASQYHSAAIDRRVNEIIGNAMPSVHNLAQARSGLRNEINKLNQIARHPPADLTSAWQQVLGDVQDREASFQSYLTFPLFPNEKALAQLIKDQMPPFDAAAQDLFQALVAQDASRVDSGLAKVDELGLTLDDRFRRLVSFNAIQGQRLGLEISDIRMQSIAIVMALDALSIGLAVLAAFMAVRILRKSLHLLEDRATELEFFAGRVAHDLKGPLSEILFSASLIEFPSSQEEVLQSYSRIKGSANRMNRVIDGLLEFARCGAHPTSARSADLGLVIDSVVSAATEEAARVHATLSIEPFDRPAWVSCSEGALISVIDNLVRNAIKFIADSVTFERRITVRVKRVLNRYRVEIEDTGPGIEAGKEEMIFKAYVRASKSTPGLGLGLATVKRIVEGYEGSVGVISNPGLGSCFWFELPRTIGRTLETEFSETKAGDAALLGHRALAGIHVLLVDDAQEILFLMKHILEKTGARVTQARSATEALSKLAKEKPNLIITDIEMPDGDGYELIEKVHLLTKNDRTHLPVIAHTGHTDEKELKKISEAGFDARFSKPVVADKLISSIRQIVSPKFS
ncbi:MAG: response regulator [Pseudobdellovibrionaceae bacterium]